MPLMALIFESPSKSLLASSAALSDPELNDRVRDALARCTRASIRVVTWRDGEYPARLRDLCDPPPLLFARGRIELLARVDSQGNHLALYGRIDIALDTFPYNGATTTCEAMWMGVPVVTLAGESHAGRVGVSLLHRVGLDDLVASDLDGYVDAAAGLAGDHERLGELRSALRARMRRSSLCDAQTFTRELEAAYREMWRTWCADGS